MAASASAVVALKTILSVLACVMLSTLLWAIATDGLSSCIDLQAKWLGVAYINFYINTAVIGAWLVYKESSWIQTAVLIFLLITLGSILTFGYIVMLLFKLTSEESSKDPLYYVLARHQKRNVLGQRSGPSVVTARIIMSALGCLMLGTYIAMLVIDGSPFRAQVFSPCMIGTLTDTYFHIVALSVWVAYKESSWISSSLWILSLFCYGSFATCAYIMRQLFCLSPEQPVSLILFNHNSRQVL